MLRYQLIVDIILLQFIESVDSELNEGLTLTSMAMNGEYMIFNT